MSTRSLAAAEMGFMTVTKGLRISDVSQTGLIFGEYNLTSTVSTNMKDLLKVDRYMAETVWTVP